MMINQFVALIVSEGLFGYSNFGFSDAHARHRLVGALILVAEKTGLWPLLLEMHDLYSITVLALGGHPSAMATESFVGDLEALNLHTKALRVLTLVDADPAGASITRTLMWQMKQLGFKGTLHLTPLMNPAHLTREQVRLNKFHLPNNNRTRKINTAWAHKTGGLSGFGGGRFEGLEVDALPWPHIRDLVAEQLTPHLRVSAEDLARRQALGELVDTMRRLLEKRLFGP